MATRKLKNTNKNARTRVKRRRVQKGGFLDKLASFFGSSGEETKKEKEEGYKYNSTPNHGGGKRNKKRTNHR